MGGRVEGFAVALWYGVIAAITAEVSAMIHQISAEAMNA